MLSYQSGAEVTVSVGKLHSNMLGCGTGHRSYAFVGADHEDPEDDHAQDHRHGHAAQRIQQARGGGRAGGRIGCRSALGRAGVGLDDEGEIGVHHVGSVSSGCDEGRRGY